MARNAPRRGRGRAAGGRRRPRPLDDEPEEEVDASALGGLELPSDEPVVLTRHEQSRRRDSFVVLGITPAVVLGLFLLALIVAQRAFPDPEESLATPTLTESLRRPTPTLPIVLEPIDGAKLTAGVVEKPPAFAWPDVDELKFVPEPVRPNEVADYTPLLAATELRRLLAVLTVTMASHAQPAQAQAAAAELAKNYPLRQSKTKVIDADGTIGYLPDDTGVGLTLSYGTFRAQIETIAASPPIRPDQRAEVEWHTLHLGDHLVRRLQEVGTGGARRSGPEAAAVHWRDHLARQVSGGR